MSLDGFVAGPGHSMEFLNGATVEDGFIEQAIASTGVVLAGRDGYDSAIGDSRPYGGAWKGPIFVLTHHPEDARPAGDITFLNCAVQEAVRIGLEAAGGKKLGIFSPNIGRQLLRLGLIDEIDIHIVPVCSATESASTTSPAATSSTSSAVAQTRPAPSVYSTYRPAATSADGAWFVPPSQRYLSTTLPGRFTMYATVHSFRTSGGAIVTAEA